MRDQETLEARVRTLGDYLQIQLDLCWLTITHKFNTRSDHDRETAVTNADWKYRQASIEWALVLVATLTDDELMDTMVHEFVHVLFAPVWEELPDKMAERLQPLNEFSTECVARALSAALRADP